MSAAAVALVAGAALVAVYAYRTARLARQLHANARQLQQAAHALRSTLPQLSPEWPPIAPVTREYYDRYQLHEVVRIAVEMVDEWDYEMDPHGYCHERPVLALLARAATAWLAGPDWLEPHSD